MSRKAEIQDYEAACQFLVDLKRRGVSLGLSRMTRLMSLLGDPQQSVPCIHLAGTNGKGSVAAMLEAILRTVGWRTGLYTSPHLVRLGERIQVDRQNLSQGALVGYVRELEPVIEEMRRTGGEHGPPTYFEAMTAIAFLHFKNSDCDIVCLEAGLGGRSDATNIVTPEVSVITSIGLDHMEFLGTTILEIATEKAGIIKMGRPVVIGRMPLDAETVIRGVANRFESLVSSVSREFGDDLARYPSTALAGAYQQWNAATAVLAARALSPRWRLTDSIVRRGLEETAWCGRWQRLSVSERTVILDSSHNAEGAEVLAGNLGSIVREFARAPLVVVGVLGKSRARPLLDVISRHAMEIRLVEPGQLRALAFEELESLIPPCYRGKVIRDTVRNIFPSNSTCSIGDVGDVVVVTGSIYLVGEVLSRIDPTLGPYEGHLQDF